MGLNMPLQTTVRPTHSNEIGQPLLQLPSVCVRRFAGSSHGSNVANEALTEGYRFSLAMLFQTYCGLWQPH